MANQVYVYTHEQLAAFLSERAATRVLVDVLKAHGETADSISGQYMSELLLGPVFQELKDSVPRDGLKRNLRQLAATVRERSQTVLTAPAESLTKETLRSIITFDPEEAAPLLLGAEDSEVPGEFRASATVLGGESSSETSSEVVHVLAQAPSLKESGEAQALRAEAEAKTAPVVSEPAVRKPSAVLSTPPVKREPLSLDKLDQAVLRFAQLENVKLVAAVRADGEVAISRGAGIELPALSRLGLMALKLLRRSGDLRSYYLAHTQGQLFLLSVGSDTLIVMGSAELNLGAVFTTFSTLKEEI